MNLKTLERLCALARANGYEDSTPVLSPTGDHGYYRPNVEAGKAAFSAEYKQYSEYHGDDNLDDGETVVNAIIIGR